MTERNDKDQFVIKISWVQPVLTFFGMFAAIIVSYMLTKSDIRDAATIMRLELEKQTLVDSAQDKHTNELQKLVEQQTLSIQQLTSKLDRYTGALEKRLADDHRPGSSGGE